MQKKKQTFSLWRVAKGMGLFSLVLYLLLLIEIFEISIFLVITIIVLGFLLKKRFFLLCEKINKKNLILGGIILTLLLGNIYFIMENEQIINEHNKKVNNLYNELKEIDTNEYRFSIFPIEIYPWGNYCNCDSFCDDYDCVMDCEDSCGECIKKQNECAEEYNECTDDYNNLVRQIDNIIK